jgi:hypothetical protein
MFVTITFCVIVAPTILTFCVDGKLDTDALTFPVIGNGVLLTVTVWLDGKLDTDALTLPVIGRGVLVIVTF